MGILFSLFDRLVATLERLLGVVFVKSGDQLFE